VGLHRLLGLDPDHLVERRDALDIAQRDIADCDALADH
jgi:hypothetical protein